MRFPSRETALVFPAGAIELNSVNNIGGIQLASVSIQGNASGDVPYAITGLPVHIQTTLTIAGGTAAVGPSFLPKIRADSGSSLEIVYAGRVLPPP